MFRFRDLIFEDNYPALQGDAWTDEAYPTKEPLFAGETRPGHELFFREAQSYGWLCYVRI